MTRPGIVAPIASGTSIEQLADIPGTASLKLDTADIVPVDTASA